jgi:hypothetical protein
LLSVTVQVTRDGAVTLVKTSGAGPENGGEMGPLAGLMPGPGGFAAQEKLPPVGF